MRSVLQGVGPSPDGYYQLSVSYALIILSYPVLPLDANTVFFIKRHWPEAKVIRIVPASAFYLNGEK